ncbi:hypothetical protein AMTRI_Chr09g36170 [Amborella trichopoda]
MPSYLLKKFMTILSKIKKKPVSDAPGSVPTDTNDKERWSRPEQGEDREGVWINGHGRVFVSNKEIAKGSNGTIVFEGLYEGRRVAVKRVLQSYYFTADKEIDLLTHSDRNSNIVRLYSVVRDQHFIYLLLERCFCNLAELIQKHSQLTDYDAAVFTNRRPNQQKFELWRNGSPSTVLENLMSSGWQAPEQLLHGRQTKAIDIFSLGCVLYFCMTKGRHPFGKPLERDLNISHGKFDLCLVDHIPEAVDLLSRMLAHDLTMRPTAQEVLLHPLLWTGEWRLKFLQETSDRIVSAHKKSNLVVAIEGIHLSAPHKRWDKNMDDAFVSNLKSGPRRYNFRRICDLIRVIRNFSTHYNQLPKHIQELLGPIPSGFYSYFASRFPNLLLEVYKIVYQYCREEVWYKNFVESMKKTNDRS